ncbi:MAG: chromosomal replication initiator protein DnaA [bacterium]|nr:chromosomal replication initiator protein DnaA [bacterium]
MEGNNKEALWESVLAELQLSLSGANFQTWFKGKTGLLSVEEGTIEIGCFSSYNKVWIEERYLGKIKEILDHLTGNSNTLTCKVAPSVLQTKRLKTLTPEDQTVPLFEGPVSEPLNEELESAGLNPNYSFSNFIVGQTNELAYAVAKAIVDEPSGRYNPLLIYGGVGVGKTHLLQAVAHTLILRRASLKLLYCSSETFTNDMVEAIQKRQTFSFRNRYRGVDVLLVDDIQFIAGRESTQEQFFHTFNELYVRGKQIVLSCDRKPEDLYNLETRLKNRFVGGMVAKIDPPNKELREAVLLAKSRALGLDIDFSLISSLAESLGPSIRELEGALMRLAAVSRLTKQKIDKNLVQTVIGLEKRNGNSASQILTSVASFFSVSEEELRGSGRNKNLVFPRQVAMYLMRQDTPLSYQKIAALMGGRDHTTVLYSVGKIEALVKNGGEPARLVQTLRAQI